MAPSAVTAIETIEDFSSVHALLDKAPFIGHHGGSASKDLIGKALRQRVESVDHELCEVDEQDAFFVADLGEVYRQHMRWKKNLARVKPFYG